MTTRVMSGRSGVGMFILIWDEQGPLIAGIIVAAGVLLALSTWIIAWRRR
jgi:hypothetical protein